MSTIHETDRVPYQDLAEEENDFADDQPVPTPRFRQEEEFEPTIVRGLE